MQRLPVVVTRRGSHARPRAARDAWPAKSPAASESGGAAMPHSVSGVLKRAVWVLLDRGYATGYHGDGTPHDSVR